MITPSDFSMQLDCINTMWELKSMKALFYVSCSAYATSHHSQPPSWRDLYSQSQQGASISKPAA